MHNSKIIVRCIDSFFQMATYTPNPNLGYHSAGSLAYLKSSSYLNGLTTGSGLPYGLTTGLDSLQSNYANYGGGNSYRTYLHNSYKL